MRLINHVLWHFIRKCVVVYFDDIVVCSLNMHDYIEHPKSVLQILREEKLYANL